jgi:8-oxo-dGTP diphosphatase
MLELTLDVRVVVFSLWEDELTVLLVPVSGEKWELPGSDLKPDEGLEEAAGRAISSHIDRFQARLEQLYTYGDPQRIPSTRQVSVVYFALIHADAVRGTTDLAKSWHCVEKLPPLEFDHPGIISYALRRLRYKLEYSTAGFQLLPDEFTLSELQHTYEIILGEKLDKRNFRRRILEAGIIEETTRLRSGDGRPARLYRYRPDAVAEVKARRLFP